MGDVKDDIHAVLNDEQRRAVHAPEGPILVLAAAGTGKTRTLVHRVAHLAASGISPERMLLLTFTNRAAREMLARASQLVGTGIASLWGGTFHHMANRILRRHADRLGYPRDYTILDQDDAQSLVGRCLKALAPDDEDRPKPSVALSLIGTARSRLIGLADLAEERGIAHELDVALLERVSEAYKLRKRELGAMDFDDLLERCLALFDAHPDVLAIYQDRFRHILVDEYQDTNHIQATLVDRMGARHRNIFVVGDDFQCIYTWRGADFRNIMGFPTRYPDCAVYKLETNYRSTPQIIALANACIAGNPEQFQKTLRPTRVGRRLPRFARPWNGRTQAEFVAQQVATCLREGRKPSEIAVLYRAHFHALELQLELRMRQLPFQVTSGPPFFEQAHIKDVCAPLRVLVNPGDELAFVRLLTMLPGVGLRTGEKLWGKLKGGFEAGNAAQRALVREALKPAARTQWDELSRVWEGERMALLASEPGRLIRTFADAFYNHYMVNTFDNSERRQDDLREFCAFADRFPTAHALLSEVALATNLDAEARTDADPEAAHEQVRLSTVHQAKGLEWPVVILLWLNDGMFPSARSVTETADGDAEERRLFYVAITRARDELILCSPENRQVRDGGVMPTIASRFITELPAGLLQRVWS